MRATALLRGGLVAAATLVAVAFGSPGWADTTISINSGNVPTTAAGFGDHSCDPNQGGGPFPGHDVWVFVLPGMHATSGDFVSVTATFGANGTITITSAADPGDFSNGGPATSKAWITTPAGWTLTAATAVITGTADSFNLSHTCPASGSPSPSPSGTPSSPAPSETPSSPAPSGSISSSTSSSPSGSPSPSESPSGSTSSSGSPSSSMSGTVVTTPSGGVPTGGGDQSFGGLLAGLGALVAGIGGSVAILLTARRRRDAA